MLGVEWNNHATSSILLKKGDFWWKKQAELFLRCLSEHHHCHFKRRQGECHQPGLMIHAGQKITKSIKSSKLYQEPVYCCTSNHPRAWETAGHPNQAVHCTSRHHAAIASSLLGKVKDLCILTQLLNQGAFFCACICIQSPLLVTLHMLLSSFCFKTCSLF